MGSASFGGLKARDIEPLLRASGFSNGVVQCLTKLAEYQTVIRESQLEIANTIVQMTSIISDFVVVAENMKNMSDKIQRKDSEVSDDEIGG